jgi:hypothetical protein
MNSCIRVLRNAKGLCGSLDMHDLVERKKQANELRIDRFSLLIELHELVVWLISLAKQSQRSAGRCVGSKPIGIGQRFALVDRRRIKAVQLHPSQRTLDWPAISMCGPWQGAIMDRRSLSY